LGFVHALNNHGSCVYISDWDATALSLLWIGFFVGLVVTAAIAPKTVIKTFILPLPGTPPGLAYAGGPARANVVSFSWNRKAIFAGSLLVGWALIWLAGAAMVDLAVSHGLVLTYF